MHMLGNLAHEKTKNIFKTTLRPLSDLMRIRLAGEQPIYFDCASTVCTVRREIRLKQNLHITFFMNYRNSNKHTAVNLIIIL